MKPEMTVAKVEALFAEEAANLANTAGYDAGIDGKPMSKDYPKGTDEFRAYEAGWLQGRSDRAYNARMFGR